MGVLEAAGKLGAPGFDSDDELSLRLAAESLAPTLENAEAHAAVATFSASLLRLGRDLFAQPSPRGVLSALEKWVGALLGPSTLVRVSLANDLRLEIAREDGGPRLAAGSAGETGAASTASPVASAGHATSHPSRAEEEGHVEVAGVPASASAATGAAAYMAPMATGLGAQEAPAATVDATEPSAKRGSSTGAVAMASGLATSLTGGLPAMFVQAAIGRALDRNGGAVVLDGDGRPSTGREESAPAERAGDDEDDEGSASAADGGALFVPLTAADGSTVHALVQAEVRAPRWHQSSSKLLTSHRPADSSKLLTSHRPAVP